MNSDSLTLNLLFLSLNHHPQRAPKKKKEGKENSSPHGVADAAKPTPQLRSVNARGGIASIPLRFVYLFFFLVKMELLAFFFSQIQYCFICI